MRSHDSLRAPRSQGGKGNWVLVAGVALAPWLWTPSASAQSVDPSAPLRIEREQIERLREEQRLQSQPQRPDVTFPAAPATPSASRVANIPVRSFEVDPSAILSREEIAAVLKPFEGRTLSLADLFEAVAAINALYDARQMPTARAFLPQQDITNGVVKISLLEAHIGAIRVGPSTFVSQAFIEKRLSQKEGELLSATRLEQDLVRFNRLHEVSLSAKVQAGASTGTTDLLLEPVDPSRFQLTGFVDNAGRTTTGENRSGLSMRALGLAGQGDILGLSLSGGRGSESYAFSYSLPITRDDLKLDLSRSSGKIKVINGDFVPLDIGGKSRELAVGLTQPFVVDSTRLWSVFARLARKTSVTEFGGIQQTPVEGLVLSLGVQGEQQSGTASWTFDTSVNQGVREWEGQGKFTALRLNTSWLNRISPRMQVVLRGGLQYAQTALVPSSEQFVVGGSTSVRGYSEGLLSGRSGFLASAELRYLLQDPQKQDAASAGIPLLTGVAFLDHGAAFPYRPAPLAYAVADDYLTGAGFGVVAEVNRNVSARVTLGWPLRLNTAETAHGSPVVNFALNFSWN